GGTRLDHLAELLHRLGELLHGLLQRGSPLRRSRIRYAGIREVVQAGLVFASRRLGAPRALEPGFVLVAALAALATARREGEEDQDKLRCVRHGEAPWKSRVQDSSVSAEARSS